MSNPLIILVPYAQLPITHKKIKGLSDSWITTSVMMYMSDWQLMSRALLNLPIHPLLAMMVINQQINKYLVPIIGMSYLLMCMMNLISMY